VIAFYVLNGLRLRLKRQRALLDSGIIVNMTVESVHLNWDTDTLYWKVKMKHDIKDATYYQCEFTSSHDVFSPPEPGVRVAAIATEHDAMVL
jgi:hypothetical protein